MKGRISNKMGEIQINPDVIALYAGTIAFLFDNIWSESASGYLFGGQVHLLPVYVSKFQNIHKLYKILSGFRFAVPGQVSSPCSR